MDNLLHWLVVRLSIISSVFSKDSFLVVSFIDLVSAQSFLRVAWAAFVGLFIARISEGRTIRNVVMYTYIIPLAYTIVWFGVFGGVGLRQTRQAAELKQLGLDHFGDENKYVNAEFNYCYDVPQDCVKVDGSTVFKNTLPGVTPVCLFGSDGFSWYQVMYSFSYPDELKYGLGPFLSWVSLFALSIYFITSSDSGSLIVDVLAANGEVDAHWIQRVFWAVTEGAVVGSFGRIQRDIYHFFTKLTPLNSSKPIFI